MVDADNLDSICLRPVQKSDFTFSASFRKTHAVEWLQREKVINFLLEKSESYL